MTENMTYEEAEARLEELVACIENREYPIDRLVEALKEARKLIRYCHQKIYEADEEVKKILESDKEES
ncbi:MAG: exodeoxyribonuclease VII small subunit [Bacteroidaceae bacterium]|nr:exodeoxyribonuclease VII small subunit [Bacteroidaceae bacterium]